MGRFAARIGCGLLLISGTGCAKPAARRSATVFVSADVRGYLGPCGCSENMRGGTARTGYQILQARKEGRPVLFFDAGNLLFGRLDYPPSQLPQERRKAEAIASAYLRLGLVAHGVGPLDRVAGEDFLSSLHLPDRASGRWERMEVGGFTIAAAFGDTAQQLIAAARSARAEPASWVIGVLQQSYEGARRDAVQIGTAVDLLVAARSEGEAGAEDNRLETSSPPVVQLQSKGRSLLKIDLGFEGPTGPFLLQPTDADTGRLISALDERVEWLTRQLDQPGMAEEAKRMRRAKLAELVDRRHKLATTPLPLAQGNRFQVRFIPLDSTLPETDEIRPILAAYDRDVAQLNLEWAKAHGEDCPKAKPDQPSFVGNQACESCHPEAVAFWKTTRHSRAYQTLEQQQKQYRVDCVRCHVTGADAPGGVCRIDKVEGRRGVGCESCHGPGSFHADNPSSDNIHPRPGKAACVGCHDPENSPHFDFAAYLPQILGSGHGAPGRGRH